MKRFDQPDCYCEKCQKFTTMNECTDGHYMLVTDHEAALAAEYQRGRDEQREIDAVLAETHGHAPPDPNGRRAALARKIRSTAQPKAGDGDTGKTT